MSQIPSTPPSGNQPNRDDMYREAEHVKSVPLPKFEGEDPKECAKRHTWNDKEIPPYNPKLNNVKMMLNRAA